MVQDILTGAGAHLIINAVLGLIGAAFATLVLVLVRSQASRTPAAR